MLDNVWSVEVVNACASTGFHVLVTTRHRKVISAAHFGLCTEVGDMSKEDALEVLRKASEARAPLPAEQALQVLIPKLFSLPLDRYETRSMKIRQPPGQCRVGGCR